MAYGNNQSLDLPGLLAGADLSSAQFHWVKLASTAGEVVACNATTDHAIGILQNDPTDGQAAEVRVLGVSKLVGGGSISAGNDVGWNSTSRGAARSAAGSRSAATAVETVTTDGDILTVVLHGYWRR